MKKQETNQKGNLKFLIGIAVGFVVTLAIVLLIVLLPKHEKLTITFDTNGGSAVSSMEVVENDNITLPTPTKEGYKFNGWKVNGVIVPSNYKVTSSETLVADWISEKAETITITFNSDGGTTVSPLIIVKGESIVLPQAPTKKGYTFVTWKDSNEVPISDGAMLDSNITLKAYWDKEPEIDTAVAVTEVTLNNNSVSMVVNNTTTLTATVKPSNATNKKITWTSSNTSVATVDSTGKVKAVGIGTSTITAKSNNNKVATAVVKSNIKSLTVLSTATSLNYYGTIKNASLSLQIDSNGYTITKDMISWNVPNSSGYNVPANFTPNGKTGTLYTNTSGMSGNVVVTVKIGDVTATKTIIVEPTLMVTTGTGNNLKFGSDTNLTTSDYDSNNRAQGSFNTTGTLSVVSNTNVTWAYPTNSEVIAGVVTVSDPKKALKLSLQYKAQQGIQVTATTPAGQVRYLSITPQA